MIGQLTLYVIVISLVGAVSALLHEGEHTPLEEFRRFWVSVGGLIFLVAIGVAIVSSLLS